MSCELQGLKAILISSVFLVEEVFFLLNGNVDSNW